MMRSTTINSYIPLFLCLIAVALTTVSCEGPAGPEGPRGLQGEQGPVGPQGPEGNANIMYSEWMDIDWREESSNNTIKQMPILESRITKEFLNDGGIVLMFMQFEQNNGIVVHYTLPLIAGSGGKFHFRFITFAGEDEGGITFLLVSLDGTTIPDDLWEDFQVRYVLIPGSVSLAAKGVDWENYDALTEYYGIPD